MLDLASYKSILESIDQLSTWLSEAKSHADMPVEPPKELVAQFEAALNKVETVTEPSSDITTKPGDIIAESPLFSSETPSTNMADRPVMPNPELITVTDLERINVNRGMETLDAVHRQKGVEYAAQEIFKILSKDSHNLSPSDLFQIQNFAGVMRTASEYGKKTSEGIAETLEIILDAEG